MTGSKQNTTLEDRLRDILENLKRLLNPEPPKPARVPIPVRAPRDPRYR